MKLPKWAAALPWDVINFKAEEHGVDKNLIAAIMYSESGGRTWACRFEPRTYANSIQSGKYLVSHREFASHCGISAETEQVFQMTSWGLMQVMGFVARELGFKGMLPELCMPEVGVEYGCLKLKQLLQKYDQDDAVVSAYNQGGAYKDNTGMFKNQKKYVDPVCRLLRELQALD